MKHLKTDNFLICLTGLPASGKTTFAKTLKIVLEDRFESYKVDIIDPDKIRDSLSSGEFDYSKEQLVRKENLKDIRDALKKPSESETIAASYSIENSCPAIVRFASSKLFTSKNPSGRFQYGTCHTEY